ncbi:MAG: BBP7 family outer membrane beta-barrel protein [Pirellulaceae bacterium]
MKSFYLKSLAVGLGLCLASVAGAQTAPYGSPSLLPMPQSGYRYPTAPVSASAPQGVQQGNWNNYYASTPKPSPDALPSPSDGHHAPMPQHAHPHHHQPPQHHGHAPYGEMQGPAMGGAACGNGMMNGGYSCVGDNSYMDAMGAPWTACGVGCGADCGWYGGAAGLIMTRDTGNGYWFSYYDSNEAAQLLDTRDTIEWGGGAEAWIGKWFACGQFGVEGVYWGLYPGEGETNLYAGGQPGNLNAILNFNQLNYNGFAANMSTDAAQRHRLRTNYQAHNAEINFLGGMLGGYGATRFNWLAGFRYFRFEDGLEFASDPLDTTFSGAAPEIYYNVDVDNNLFGFQLGGNGEVYLTQRFSLDLGAKFGLFGNHVNHSQSIGGSAGLATINNGPFLGQAYNVNSQTDTVSFLGEMRAGMNYQITNHWRLLGGYRAVGVTGLALTTNQIPMDLRGLNDVNAVDTNGSLILHGAYAGAEFTW